MAPEAQALLASLLVLVFFRFASLSEAAAVESSARSRVQPGQGSVFFLLFFSGSVLRQGQARVDMAVKVRFS